jgi:hypothetical protein
MSHHIPHSGGQYLRQLALGLVHRKLSHALAAVANPRLSEEAPTNGIDRRIQVSLNNVARTITQTPKTAHVRVATLMANAKIPLYNRMVVRAVATEVWNARNSVDGPNGSHNPAGNVLFPNIPTNPLTRPSRASAAGHIRVPARGCNTFVRHAAEVWNLVPNLREATTQNAARHAAGIFANSCPI